jgi:hypothetical protein
MRRLDQALSLHLGNGSSNGSAADLICARKLALWRQALTRLDHASKDLIAQDDKQLAIFLRETRPKSAGRR